MARIPEESRQIETKELHERESIRRTWMNSETFVKDMVDTDNSIRAEVKTLEERAKAKARTNLEPQFVFRGHRALAFVENSLQVLSAQVR